MMMIVVVVVIAGDAEYFKHKTAPSVAAAGLLMTDSVTIACTCRGQLI